MKRPSKITWMLACAVVALLSVLSAYQATAQVVDDPQIYVCTGCTKPPGGDPNTIDPSNITLGFAGNSDTGASPLLVIVAVPNGGTNPTISLPTGVNTFTNSPTNSAYGVTIPSSGLLGSNDGTLTSGDIYSALGLNGPNSLSFVNMSGFDSSHLGLTVTSFTLYVYAVDYAMTGTTPLVGMDFENIAPGSFIGGASCTTFSATTACSGTDVGATPFTNAGVVVPEPVSMLLYGTGLVTLGAKLRRRKSKQTAAAAA